jgi:hypothetical protein
MADGEDQTDELALICSKLGMVRRDLLAKEGDGTITLMKYGAEARLECVAFDDEVVTEVRQLEHRRCGERVLERTESRLRLLHPSEAGLAKQG